MRTTTTVVIGAGHCGLAMSRGLAERSIDHVVLERGEVAHSWRTQRWDSVRLLTPNWMTRLPGHAYTGDDPHGCLGMGRLLDTLDAWADRAGVDAGPPERFAPTTVPAPVLTMPLTGVGAVVWATGFRPELSFLSDTGVLDRQGRVVHNGGVTERPRPGST